MFQKIVVPVDGSEGAMNALARAAEVAEKFGGELKVITVIQPFTNAASVAVVLDPSVINSRNEEMSALADEILAGVKDKVKEIGYTGKIDYKVEHGHPAERIIKYIDQIGADAVVIGSRGLSGIAEFFLGSVSTKVAQYSKVPVLIIK